MRTCPRCWRRRSNTSHPALNEALKADHGFNVDSRAIRDLVSIMSAYDGPTRREYLQFITGSPKLPIGGAFHAHSFMLCAY